MNFDEYRKYLLSQIPTAKPASGNKFIACRCFYCPDGKSKDTRHFYIYIPQNKDEPSWYYCHKCHNSGLVSHRTLLEWGIYDPNLAQDLINHNNKCSKIAKNSKYYDQQKLNIVNYNSDSELSRLKLDYINKRIGTNFTINDLSNLKICLNLEELLNKNNITTITRNQNIVRQLNENFLGFMSIDNVFLNMRRICPEGKVYESIDKRYVNYKIYDKFDTSNRFYSIPNSIDLSSPEKVKLHIAEGPFDILSIYQNVRKRERGIYTSIAGSNYLGITFYFLIVYKLINVELHYYPDNDESGSNDVMSRIANVFKPLGIDVYIHRNLFDGEKDFGVPLNRIKESIIKM